ncbi:phosphonate C-P lyase system protein PhnG [Bacillus sp. CMF21]|nr:phosphonate C-P lyase system protein PhnG [Bacillus sp. CMF21]
MKKSRLSKILIEGNPNLLKKFSAQVEETHTVKVNRSPSTGLVMMKTRDSVSRQPFYMGEVLITDCTVEVNGSQGLGVLIGEEPDRAYSLAVVDAAFNAKLPIAGLWLHELEEEERNIAKLKQKEMSKLARSQVSFDTMEDYNDKS